MLASSASSDVRALLVPLIGGATGGARGPERGTDVRR
jgi:hypothetical protein